MAYFLLGITMMIVSLKYGYCVFAFLKNYFSESDTNIH